MFEVLQTEQSKCKEHGAYESRKFAVGTREIWSDCPKCQAEKDAADEEERIRRDQEERAKLLLRNAQVPRRFEGKRFADYRATTEPQKKALETVTRYARSWPEPYETGRSLLLVGGVGTGKTHLACALIDALARCGAMCRYATVAGMVREVRATWRSNESEIDAMRRFTNPSLLVLDEVGVQSASDSERNLLFEIVDWRYRDRLPTVVCGNVELSELDLYLGQRIVDRLREAGGEVVAFSWASHRKACT